jgi:hypothetical protein
MDDGARAKIIVNIGVRRYKLLIFRNSRYHNSRVEGGV